MKNIVKVHAVKMSDGMIRIERFENLLSPQKIKEKYGDEVFRLYKNGPYMYKSDNNCYISKLGTVTVYTNGKYLYNGDTFNNIISGMKEAGKNLVSAIRKAEKTSVFTVEI